MNPFSSAVNQKLFLTGLLLDQGRPDQDRFGHIEMALGQAAVFQLMCAYRLYLNEIGSNYIVPLERQLEDVEMLCEALLAVGKQPSEAREIVNLLGDDKSWLSEFFAANRKITEPVSLAGETKSKAIPLQDVDEAPSGKITFTRVRYFLDAFREMLERHRELMVEC